MIVVHDNNYEVFKILLNESVAALNIDALERKEYYITRGGTDLEGDIYKFMRESKSASRFSKIELVSGQKFPDIVAYINDNEAFGLEVKTTKSNKWKSTGSSIFEGTRVPNVNRIHLLFGKLVEPVSFKCRKYEDCLYDVAITHSPRYLIDMETKPQKTIFDKIGCTYDDLRARVNPFGPIKKYLRNKLKEGDDLWWMDNNGNERSLEIRLWANLPASEQMELRNLAFAYFPDLLSQNQKKYGKVATWLVSRFGVVNPSLRDVFSAGGTVKLENEDFPRIIHHLYTRLSEIVEAVSNVESDDIIYYWETEKVSDDKVSQWKKICLKHCKNNSQFNSSKQIQIIEGLLGL